MQSLRKEVVKEKLLLASEEVDKGFWFPGRWVGGVSMVLAPVFLLLGVLLRIKFHFFFPQQLAAFKEHPVLLVTAYNFFVTGNI